MPLLNTSIVLLLAGQGSLGMRWTCMLHQYWDRHLGD